MNNKGVLFYVMLLIVGAALCYIGGFVLKGEELKAVSGVCIGIGAGLLGMSIAQLVQIRIADKNPAYKCQADIEANDERNIYITGRAKAKAFDAMSIVFGILMLIFALINTDLIMILLVVAAYLLVHAIYIVYLNKYTKEL